MGFPGGSDCKEIFCNEGDPGSIPESERSLGEGNGYPLQYYCLESSCLDNKKRWQDYTELYKKGLNDLDNHDGVITHLELEILECEVTWALMKHYCEQS